jgi:NAD(P)-dependent dehydrogenase (short-subunit alcohol dehydrogenase family)
MSSSGEEGRPKPFVDARRVAGKVAIVTGAGSIVDEPGVGSATAEVLAAGGARVCVLDLDEGRAATTCVAIAAAGGEAFSLTADITCEGDCIAAVRETVSRYGQLDILVNNVGVAGRTALADLTPERWQQVLSINAMGAMLMSKHSVPTMAAKGGGAIVNISSIAGLRAHGDLTYAASKAALVALGNNIAVSHGRDHIRVNAIAPGYLRTPMAVRRNAGARAVRRDVAPLGIEGDAWDVALAVLFLASDEARFINCAMVPVDGGAMAIGPITAYALATGGRIG